MNMMTNRSLGRRSKKRVIVKVRKEGEGALPSEPSLALPYATEPHLEGTNSVPQLLPNFWFGNDTAEGHNDIESFCYHQVLQGMSGPFAYTRLRLLLRRPRTTPLYQSIVGCEESFGSLFTLLDIELLLRHAE